MINLNEIAFIDTDGFDYNFTENYTKYRVTQEIIQKVQRQSRKKTAYNKNLCSYKFPPLPPSKTGTAFVVSVLY